MAIKPLKPLKRHSKPLENWQIDYLITGNYPEVATLESWYMCNTNQGAAEWGKHKKWILKDFTQQHPGKRPWAWWRYDAEPRLRVGGIGTPFGKSLSFGVPRSYWDKWCEDYYNGRMNMDHDPFLKARYTYKEGDAKWCVGIDFDDPPLYESQPSYLKRHSLLTKAE